jgi:hypothetical protein
MEITTTINKNTIDGVTYHVTRNGIEYEILRNADCIV